MKKPILNLTIICSLLFSITSCGKTSKEKMSNKWKVTSYSQSSLNQAGSGWSEQGTATSLVITSTIGTISTYSYGGVINENSFTINKDGSWESTKDYTTSQSDGSYTDHTVLKESGTWAFVGTNKTENFKKNERIVFYTLSSQENNTSITNNSSSTDTYTSGETSITYTVKESTPKKLVLSFDGEDNSNISGGSQYTQRNKSEMTLEQK